MTDAAIRDDIALLMAKRHANGADFWAGPGGKIYVGNPFSTLACLGMLHELGVTDEDEVVSGIGAGSLSGSASW